MGISSERHGGRVACWPNPSLPRSRVKKGRKKGISSIPLLSGGYAGEGDAYGAGMGPTPSPEILPHFRNCENVKMLWAAPTMTEQGGRAGILAFPPSLCNRALLSPTQKAQATEAEKQAATRAEKIKRAKPSAPVRRSTSGYRIEVAHNDELFIINGEKYGAQTYCLGWKEGQAVLFIEGSFYGACASAKLYNLDRKESCDVWCE